MVSPGAAPECTSLARGVSGKPTDTRTVEGDNTSELGRTAPSRDRSAVNGLEGQIAIAPSCSCSVFLTETSSWPTMPIPTALIADPHSPDATVAAVPDTQRVKAADAQRRRSQQTIPHHGARLPMAPRRRDLGWTMTAADRLCAELNTTVTAAATHDAIWPARPTWRSRCAAAWVGQGRARRGEHPERASASGRHRWSIVAHNHQPVGWQFQQPRCSPHSRRYSEPLVDHRYRRTTISDGVSSGLRARPAGI